MVSSSSIYPFQTGSPVVELVSAAAHGLGFDCGAGLEKQLGGGRLSRRQYVGQRLDRLSQLGHLGAAFPLFTVGIVMRGWITQTQKREHPPILIPVENGPLLQNKAQYRLGSEIK